MRSTEACAQLSEQLRDELLDIARSSIGEGLRSGHPAKLMLHELDEVLRRPAACFVTLHKRGELRGCIGDLEARVPLAQCVADNAYNAAFRDPRFPALHEVEADQLEVEISVLGQAQPMSIESEADLFAQLQPGRDGLILEEGRHRATFLPTVWDQLPDARSFVAHLKLKAGLPADYWSEDLCFSRYGTESFGD